MKMSSNICDKKVNLITEVAKKFLQTVLRHNEKKTTFPFNLMQQSEKNHQPKASAAMPQNMRIMQRVHLARPALRAACPRSHRTRRAGQRRQCKKEAIFRTSAASGRQAQARKFMPEFH